MGPVAKTFVGFVHHRYTYMVTGLLLIFSGTVEFLQDFGYSLMGLRIGAHHGIIVLGLFHVGNAFANILAGHQSVFVKED